MTREDKKQIARFDAKWGARLREDGGIRELSKAEREDFDRDFAPLRERANFLRAKSVERLSVEDHENLGTLAEDIADPTESSEKQDASLGKTWVGRLSGFEKHAEYQSMLPGDQQEATKLVVDALAEREEYSFALQRVFMNEPLPKINFIDENGNRVPGDVGQRQVERQLKIWNGETKRDPHELMRRNMADLDGLDYPVKVVAMGEQQAGITGCIVNARDIYGRTTWEIEQMLGFKIGNFPEGIQILRAAEVPKPDQIAGVASTRYYPGKIPTTVDGKYQPAHFDAVDQFRLHDGCGLPIAADRIFLGRNDRFGSEALQREIQGEEQVTDEELSAHQEKMSKLADSLGDPDQLEESMGLAQHRNAERPPIGSTMHDAAESYAAQHGAAAAGEEGIGPREKDLRIGGR